MKPPFPLRAGRGGGQAAARWAPWLLFLAAATWLFRGPLSGGGIFYYRDILQNYRPVLAAAAAELAAGRWPLWNPWLGLGQPLMANPNHLVLHPNTLLAVLLPVDAAITASIWLGTVLALAGTFLLVRRLGGGRPGAVLAASAYGMSGLFLSFGNLPNLLGSAAWLPLVLFWTIGFWQRPTVRHAVPAVLGSGLLWICAEPATLAAWLLIGTALAFNEMPDRDGAELRPGPAGRLWRFGGITAAGLLVGAVQWLPFLGLLGGSRRGGGFAYEAAAKWSLPPLRLAEMLLPGLFGEPVSLDPRQWWGSGYFPTGFPLLLSIYVGPLVLFLALAAVAIRRRRGEAALAAAVLIPIAIALGSHGPLHRLIYDWIPGFDRIRYPIRFLLPVQLGLALLAGRGLGALLPSVRSIRSGRALRIGAGAAAAIGAAALVTVALGGPARIAAAVGGAIAAPPIAGPFLQSAIRDGLFRVVLLAAILFLLLYLRRSGRMGAAPAAWSLALVVLLDLAAAAPNAVPVERAEMFRRDPAIVSFLEGRSTLYRVQRERRPAGVRVRMPDPAVSWGYAWDRETLSRATPVEFGLRMGFGEATDLLDPARPAGYRGRAERLDAASRQRLLCRSGVRWLLTYEPPGAEGARRVATLGRRSEPPIALYELPCPLPRVVAVGGVRRERDPERVWSLLLDPVFDPRAEVILEGEGAGHETRFEPGPIPARVVRDAPGRVEVEVMADRPGHVVLLENRDPGWQVRVDGEEGEVLPANGLFQAVRVGPGVHRVRFEYRPRSVGAGILLALAGLVAGGLGLPLACRGRGGAAAPHRRGLALPAAESS